MFTATKCCSCGLIFSNGIPVAQFEERYFQTNYGHSQYRNARVELFRNILARLEVTLEPPILDIGAGMGLFLQALPRDLASRTTLVEPSIFARNYLRETITPDVFSELGEIPIEHPPFSTATLWDVLAHADDPFALVSQARQFLAEDGLLIVKTPFHPSSLFRAARVLAPFKKGHSLLHIPSMRFHFTPDSLAALLNAAGFNVEMWNWVSEAPPGNKIGLGSSKDLILRLSRRLVTKEVSFVTAARVSENSAYIN